MNGQQVNQEFTSISLDKAGFNRDSIENLIGLIRTSNHPDFRGMVVLKDGQLAIEEHFNTFWRASIMDIRSAGKSVTALLLGIALKEGLIADLDQPISSFFPTTQRMNPAYKDITLSHLLDMSSGIDADTDDPTTPGQAGQWIGLDDWKDYLLNVPTVSPPGNTWKYADINCVLIGLAIEEAAGMSLKAYAQKKLFEPLGIDQYYWYTNEAQQTGAAGNLYISTYDFAKIGQLVINQGRWNGIQLIDNRVLDDIMSSKRYPEVNDWFPLADHYGMFWYKSTRKFGDRAFDYAFASGNGGNYLILVPDENMVIALTSSAYGPSHGHGRSYAIVEKILSALE